MEQAGRRSWRCCRSHQPLILLSHLTPIPKLLHLQGNCRVEQVELQGNPVPGPTTREIGGRGEAASRQEARRHPGEEEPPDQTLRGESLGSEERAVVGRSRSTQPGQCWPPGSERRCGEVAS